jgi:excisionase family DNA binding protein
MANILDRRLTVMASEMPRYRVQRGVKPACGVGSSQSSIALPALRFDVREAALILRMSRAQLYNRMKEGKIKGHKDGARTYITRAELERYVRECDVEVSE